MSFNSRAPRGARPVVEVELTDLETVSIHVPLAEHDQKTGSLFQLTWSFQFTCPSRSTTDGLLLLCYLGAVSIHVPLAEHDALRGRAKRGNKSFNSRAPRGARQTSAPSGYLTIVFQFTCPSRSTTSGRSDSSTASPFQFTCPSRSTTYRKTKTVSSLQFQFTCPSRSTTVVTVIVIVAAVTVSIHVPLAEHDGEAVSLFLQHKVSIHVPLAEHDLSNHVVDSPADVSIHVPLAEHDLSRHEW